MYVKFCLLISSYNIDNSAYTASIAISINYKKSRHFWIECDATDATTSSFQSGSAT